MKNFFFTSGMFALLSCMPAGAYETPTMGWSSWNTYGVEISEEIIKLQTDAILSTGLKDLGYIYINIDDGFFGGRDSEGNLVFNAARFPNGLQPVVEYIHSKGLKAGIYSDAGENTCGSYYNGDTLGVGVGLYGHDQQDIDLLIKELGFDFIKVDYCGGTRNGLSEQERYTAIHEAILNTGRTDVRLNVCRWAYPGTWVNDVATSWRTTEDIYLGWNSLLSIIGQNLYLSAYATEGKFNDMDMLEVGRGMTTEEDKTHFGMWCIMSSPLLIGCDLTEIPDDALELLKNEELIALNQDPLALQAYVVSRDGGAYVLVKDIGTLHGRQRAVAFYNSTDEAVTMSVDFLDLDLGGQVKVRDVFNREDLGEYAGNMEVEVPMHGTRIYTLEAEKRYERSKYEAETAWLNAYQELENNQVAETGIYEEADHCSGGAKAGWLGKSKENYLEWRNVYSEEGGTYTLTLTYISGEERQVCLSVNGGADTVLSVNSGSWSEPARVEVEVTLEQGNNVIRLHNDTDWMPDIDCMELEKAGSLDLYQRRLESAIAKARNTLAKDLPGNVGRKIETALEQAGKVEEAKESYEAAIEALEAAVADALEACASYEAFAELLQQCQENAGNTEADATLDEFNLQLQEFARQAGEATSNEELETLVESLAGAATSFLTSASAWPQEGKTWDVTILMDNPSFSPDETGWSSMPTLEYGVAEFYNCNFNMYQYIRGVKNGNYTVQVQALYRTGVNDGGEAYGNGTEAIPARLYANSESVPLMSLYAHPYEGDTGIFGSLDLKNGYINSMYAASVCFAEGLYLNRLDVEVDDGVLQIGLANEGQQHDCWCCFGNFRLYYSGTPDTSGTTAVDDAAVADGGNGLVDVYTVDGIKVKESVEASTALEGLEKGTYIVNGKKVFNL